MGARRGGSYIRDAATGDIRPLVDTPASPEIAPEGDAPEKPAKRTKPMKAKD